MRFIVFEGLDGAGKSTQIKMLGEHLKKKGKTVFTFHFPHMDSKRFGVLIARFLRGDFGDNNQVNPYLVASLYAGDRFDAKEMISEKLKTFDYVIVDRYVDSNIAYQCAKEAGQEKKEALKNWIYDLEYNLYDLPIPDLTLFFDVPVTFVEKKLSETRKCDDRKYLKGKKDIHEKNISFQEKVRDEYLKLFRKEPDHYIVDCSNAKGATKKPDAIFKGVAEVLKQALGK
jgi:dTMP kinase